MYVLLIDIGNSRIKWRIVDPRVAWPRAEGPAVDDASAAHAHGDVTELARLWQARRDVSLAAVHLSNVAGSAIEDALRDAVRAAWGDVPIHRLIPGAAQCGVVNGYRDPAQLGPDRWAAMLGAHALAPDRHLLICSFGTATTIDLLVVENQASAYASFVGGLILPGIETMRRALARDTARLPLTDGAIVDFADRTDDAIASGIVAAQSGAVIRATRDALVRVAQVDSDTAQRRALDCLLSGGGADAMVAPLRELGVPTHIVSDLVLRGLHAVARDLQHVDSEGRIARDHPLVRERL